MEKSLDQDSRIRVLSLYAGDFVKIMMTLSDDDNYGFDSGLLAKCVRGAIGRFASRSSCWKDRD